MGFFKKDVSAEEFEKLKEKIRELNTALDVKDNEFQIFLNELHLELLETVEKHEIVNSQHGVLGQMVTKLLGQFDDLKSSTVTSSEVSKLNLEKGEKLINSSIRMVDISKEGKDSLDKVQELINVLGEQSKKTSSSMAELSQRSKQIEDIVHVISDVSEQQTY